MTSEKKIEDQGHIVINIWNIKKQGIDKILPMFELKPESNNEDIYEVRLFLQCKIKFKSPHPKYEISQCNS